MAYYSNQNTPIYSGAAGLGDMAPALIQSFRDGSLGTDAGELSSFRDGSLGTDAGELSSFRDGSLGGCRSCGGLGQDAVAVLDMKDPEVVRQVKGLMALLVGPTLNDVTPEEVFTNDFWGPDSTEYAQKWIIVMGSGEAGVDMSGMFVPPETYPNASGIVAMMQMASAAGLVTEANADSLVPALKAFINATQGDPSKGRVTKPNTTSGLKTAHLMMLGAGAVLVGVVLFGMTKRR